MGCGLSKHNGNPHAPVRKKKKMNAPPALERVETPPPLNEEAKNSMITGLALKTYLADLKTRNQCHCAEYLRELDDQFEEGLLTSEELDAAKEIVTSQCTKCDGSGNIDDAVFSFEAPNSELCQICFCDPQEYGVSTECKHFFCGDCIKTSLQTMCDTKQFPAICPMCRASENSDGGVIPDQALLFLCEVGVIDKKFMQRLIALQRNEAFKHGEIFFKCPAKNCDEWVLDKHEEKVQSGFILQESRSCPKCRTVICLQCHEVAEKNHVCKTNDGKVVMDNKTLAYLKKEAKQCPKCGFFVQKNGGCHTMLCGTNSHGKVADALKNGGCGHQFDWNTLKDTHTYHTDIFGKRFDGIQPENLRIKYKNSKDPKIIEILRKNHIVL